MSKRYFTSDWHLNQSNIAELSRKFSSVERMGEILLINANQQAKNRDDLIIHVGDFYCYRSDRGSKIIKIHPSEYLSKINATFINVQGNHDNTNKVLSIGADIVTNIGPYYNCHITHHPSYDENSRVYYKKNLINICGHVHRSWKTFYDHDRNILNINVGVDVWKYNLVPEVRLVEIIDNFKVDDVRFIKLRNRIKKKS
jgi:calcineurin-like phosphoesterase family protein